MIDLTDSDVFELKASIEATNRKSISPSFTCHHVGAAGASLPGAAWGIGASKRRPGAFGVPVHS